MAPQQDMDKDTLAMYIAQCQICTICPALRLCNNGCKFSVGLAYEETSKKVFSLQEERMAESMAGSL